MNDGLTIAPSLEARSLRVRRGDRSLLRGVDIAVRPGEILGVLGPSGAGKSTLFRALVGESRADEGRVLLFGRDVSSEPLWRRARLGVGYVPQGSSVLLDLTVRENLATFRAVAGLAPGDVDGAASKFGLADRIEVRAGALSAGERRRLELARALTRRPRVLVCDEPFAGVDPLGAARLGELLRAHAQGGAAVILADHHVNEALRVCTTALLLLDGAVAAMAPAAAFPELDVVRGRYLGTLR